MKRPNVVIDLSEKQNAHLVKLWNRAIHADSGLLLAQLDPNSGKMKVAAFSEKESNILARAFSRVAKLGGFENTESDTLSLSGKKDGEEA